MNTIWMDIRYAWRVLCNKPGLTFVAILALALGIGANTALFSILYAVLWKPLPYQDPERIAVVWETNEREARNVASPANFLDWKEQNHVFADMAGFVGGVTNFNSENEPEEISIQFATSNLFSVLGTRPFLGRAFQSADDKTGDRIVVLSYGLWNRRFGGDPKVIGRQINLSGRQAKVVGVMPENFQWFLKEGAIFTLRTSLCSFLHWRSPF